MWSAIAYLQRAEPETVILVYSGDYPAASKEEMLAKVFERFSIKLSGDRMAFIPLPSRHLISDTYWKHFTLLGQSFGSLVLAWEGLCGKEGLWGDVFLGMVNHGGCLSVVDGQIPWATASRTRLSDLLLAARSPLAPIHTTRPSAPTWSSGSASAHMVWRMQGHRRAG